MSWGPDGPTVNLERVSHMIEELVEVDNNFMGRAKDFGYSIRKDCKELIDEGARLGVSSRGMGSLKPSKDEVQEVQGDFYLVPTQRHSCRSFSSRWHSFMVLWKVRNGFGIMGF